MKLALFLAAGFLTGSGHALTVRGTVSGAVVPDLRVSAWVVTAAGQPVQELVSVPVDAQAFHLEIPPAPPTFRSQATLTAQNVAWPGLLEPIQVTGEARTAELRFFVYRDLNASGQHDGGERLREVTPRTEKGTLFVAWASSEVAVQGARGYFASFKQGWNAWVIEVGRAVKINPFFEEQVEVTLGGP